MYRTMKPLVGTYRVQLCPDLTLSDAAGTCAYWAALGISHLYVSPYLQATPGSTHGYDVVDPGRVNRELGGEAARVQLVEALTATGLRQLIDVVPNHMAIRSADNAWWWDVLENGPSSRYASYFDVEWRASGSERVLLPILGDQYGVELEAGRISLARDGGRFYVQYFEHRHPLGPRSLGHLLRPVAARMQSPQLGFIADALAELPSPNAPDANSRRRRHRDKLVLQAELEQLCLDSTVARAIDEHLHAVNAAPDAVHEVLELQTYRLAYWRVGNHELEYRRFFDINSLVGLRVEDEEVLQATHVLVLQWLAAGAVDGLRIDHIDGLYDPTEYLTRLRQRAADAWIVVEKILEDDEELPPWPVAGTTGYDFLNQAQRLLTDPEGEAPLTALYHDLLGVEEVYESVVKECKRLVLKEGLASDVQRLVNRLADICQRHRRYRDHSRMELLDVIVELCVAFPVYRTYVRPRSPVRANDRRIIHEACQQALQQVPDLDERLMQFVEGLLLLQYDGDNEHEFVMRFQQLTGPAMAKGAEDTAFYRYARLVALNEVGGSPSNFSVEVEHFHHLMQRRHHLQSQTLNATSTHDSKRSEDVRARLLALSEVPERWRGAIAHWRSVLASAKTPLEPDDSLLAPDSRTEYFLLQNLVGAWPIEEQRMVAYMTKALRESKLHSSWHAPNEAYEQAVTQYIQALYANTELLANIDAFVRSLEDATYSNSLCQTVLKLFCPGVPDIYQGTELWDFSLVDPDNRRPVDYSRRRELLATLATQTPAQLWEQRSTGAIKLSVILQGVSLRRRRAACFGATGSYQPLWAEGRRAERIVGFQRGAEVAVYLARWSIKFGDDLAETTLELPPGKWLNVFSGADALRGRLPAAEVFAGLPVAALEKTAD